MTARILPLVSDRDVVLERVWVLDPIVPLGAGDLFGRQRSHRRANLRDDLLQSAASTSRSLMSMVVNQNERSCGCSSMSRPSRPSQAERTLIAATPPGLGGLLRCRRGFTEAIESSDDRCITFVRGVGKVEAQIPGRGDVSVPDVVEIRAVCGSRCVVDGLPGPALGCPGSR